MTKNNQMQIKKDVTNKKAFITRDFDASVEQVWKHWTDAKLLDSWWAPKPWRAETKTMNFSEGGIWLYCMVGPEGERHWARFDYETIAVGKSFTGKDSFCDENGNKTADLPSTHWKNDFNKSATGTTVKVELTFSTEEDMKKLFEMGFEEGFAMGLGNLDELLAK
jgi:uncharacterized protein YndB with AHSA1/START domain